MSKAIKTGWYVIYSRSSHEKKIHNLLQENQLESFLPLVKTIRQWSDRKKMIFKPLFPSYLFVKINSAKDFNKALSIDGVCSFIRFGKEYAIAKDEEILRVKHILGLEGIQEVEVNGNLPYPGEIRRIKHGPLSGMQCEVLNSKNKNSLLVRMDSIRQSITVKLPLKYLEDGEIMQASA